jgi:chaperone required for assembly of F1-ATPase
LLAQWSLGPLRGERVSLSRLRPRVAHVDEDFQAERWGADAEATARRKALPREFEAAGIVLALTRAA